MNIQIRFGNEKELIDIKHIKNMKNSAKGIEINTPK